MRIEWSDPEPRGLTPGAVAGMLLAAIAAGTALWIYFDLPVPACRLREATGVACPTCGSTRLAEALLHGDLVRALLSNPLLFVGLAGFATWAAVSTLAVLLRMRTPSVRLEGRERRIAIAVAILAFLANWIYVIQRDF